MLSNKLKLNDDKTEAMLVGSRQSITQTKAKSIQIGGNSISLNPHVKNLGVFLENTLSMDQHIGHFCCSAYLAMWQIASICRYLTEKKTVHLVCSFVLSRLDYCNATLAGLPATHIARLQRMQNNAARPILKNQIDNMLNHFCYTDFRFKNGLIANWQLLFFDILMVLCLSISLQR